MMQENIRLVILGLGDKVYQDALTLISHQYPGKISLHLKFNEPLAHRIYAGSDMFLMPSKYEPCGLAQMIAMRYATIPIVHRTGGLADTVVPFDDNTGKGNGFVFDEYTPTALCAAIEKAVTYYKNKDLWTKIVKNAVTTNFNWDKSAKEYIKLYKLAITKKK
jgi:starch synthase